MAIKRGIADFTLDTGRVPPWLFKRMVRLARSIIWALRCEFGPTEILKRLSDPVWFQSFGTILAFDWNASGLTTTAMGAVKQAVAGVETQLGFFVCGGKGRVSRRTPQEILNWSQRLGFKFHKDMEITSRLTAKIDSSLVQDGFNLYHHNFLFDSAGNWTVIQQGMNTNLQRARRYHWYGSLSDIKLLKDKLTLNQRQIISQIKLKTSLDLSAPDSDVNRRLSLELIRYPKDLFRDLGLLETYYRPVKVNNQMMLFGSEDPNSLSRTLILADNRADFDASLMTEAFDFKSVQKRLLQLVHKQPSTFFDLLIQPNVGAKTLRAISLVAELIYHAKPSYTDPVRYSFAHGGKDGVPYPIDTFTYDRTLTIIEKAIKKAVGLSLRQKDQALRRLFSRGSYQPLT